MKEMVDKKKLKEQFKTMIPEKGVFIFKNKVNGKVFLGSSLNLKNKDISIKLMLKNGNHFNSDLQNDWNMFGEESFEYEILEKLELKDNPDYDYKDDLSILEMIYLDKFKPNQDNCYNKTEKIRLV